MTKNDLTNGMVVVTLNRIKYLVCKTDKIFRFIGLERAIDSSCFSDDLLHHATGDYDIMEVYELSNKYTHPLSIILNYVEDSCLCIWKRKETKEMTVAEISEALGYEVKVVK